MSSKRTSHGGTCPLGHLAAATRGHARTQRTCLLASVVKRTSCRVPPRDARAHARRRDGLSSSETCSRRWRCSPSDRARGACAVSRAFGTGSLATGCERERAGAAIRPFRANRWRKHAISLKSCPVCDRSARTSCQKPRVVGWLLGRSASARRSSCSVPADRVSAKPPLLTLTPPLNHRCDHDIFRGENESAG
jgi:hypothetical protein